MSEVILVGAPESQQKAIRAAIDGGPARLKVWDEPVGDVEDAERITKGRPAVVILGPDLGEKLFEFARAIEDIDPTIATIAIQNANTSVLQRAMAAGVRGVLEPNAKETVIKEVLDEAIEAGTRLRGSHPELAASDARFITVVSAKGGAGKTVVSSNLATALAKGTDRSTVLVDLDLQFGDASTALLLSPTHSVADAVGTVNKGLDVAALKVYLTRHSPSDLFVLCAPEEPSVGELLPSEAIGRVLDTLAEEFTQVVIDTDPGLSEVTLTALERSTDIVIVADLDVPSVRGTRKLIDALDLIGMKAPARYLVLNRADSRVGLTPAEVEEVIGMRIDVELPSTRHVPVSINEGQPLVLSGRRENFSKRIVDLVNLIVPAPVERK